MARKAAPAKLAGVPAPQRATYNKLIGKGLSQAQARALSKQAVKRKRGK